MSWGRREVLMDLLEVVDKNRDVWLNLNFICIVKDCLVDVCFEYCRLYCLKCTFRSIMFFVWFVFG